MAADLILKASSVITMDTTSTRGEAVAIDTSTGRIVAVGALADVQAAAPGATVTDLGSSVLMPGFIDPHNHPALSGAITEPPARWMAPYVGYPTWASVQELFRSVDSSTPAGEAVLFSGLDRMLQGAPELTNVDLDAFFPSRPAVVVDNSGHEVYFNSAVITLNGWADGKPPADPVGARFGRNADGTSNGRAYETAAELAAVAKVLPLVLPHPLASVGGWYRRMAQAGITSTSEHTFQESMLTSYGAIASVPDVPLRLALYHMSIEASCGQPVTSPSPDLIWKQGIKLWADGSPWVGTIASSYPYLDNDVTRTAQIPLGPSGDTMMNYTRTQLDAVLDAHAKEGWQMAFHVNGDVGLDIVLDAYERALSMHGLLGTDHRWRVEHCGGARGDQFKRAAELGVTISLGAFQFIYWGDLLDGTLFDPAIGSQWIRSADAFASGAVVTFHNDGPVSPPLPLLNVQAMATRRTPSGQLHGPEQAISVEQAFRAHTANAAWQIGREKDLGTIEVGKLADFVVLSTDPFAVDPSTIASAVKVQGTYVGGRRIDLDAFMSQVEAIDPSAHASLPVVAKSARCC